MEATFDLIAQYLAGDLSEEERQEFDERFFADQAFAETVAFYLQSHQAAKASANEARLQAFTQHYFRQKPQRRQAPLQLKPYQWAVAAAVILLISALALFNLQTPSMTELYASNFEALEVSSSVRGDSTLDAQWLQAMTLYEAGKYPAATHMLEELADADQYDYQPKVHLYLGMCYLLQDQSTYAVSAFEQVSPESIYIQQADWYTAMAYLKIKDKAQAQATLQRIVAFPAHYKHARAKEILGQLEKVKDE